MVSSPFVSCNEHVWRKTERNGATLARAVCLIGTGCSPVPPRFEGGIEELIYYVAKVLPRQGFNVILIDRSANHERATCRLPAVVKTVSIPHSVPARLRILYFSLRAVGLVFKNISNIEVISVFYPHQALIFALLRRILGRPLTYTTYAHIPWAVEPTRWSFRTRLFVPVRIFFKRRCDLIITGSRRMADALSRYGRISEKKIRVVPDCVDEEEFNPGNASHREEIRDRFRLSHDDKLVLFVGRLTRAKGLHILLEAMGQVLKKDEHVHAVVVGPGRIDIWSSLTHQLGISSKVTFAGRVDRDILPKIFGAADLFVLPTVLEGGPPISCLMAMASGLPVITSEESLIEGAQPCVMKVRASDINAVSASILGLIGDKETACQLGGVARLVAVDRYSASSYGKAYADTYSCILGMSPTAEFVIRRLRRDDSLGDFLRSLSRSSRRAFNPSIAQSPRLWMSSILYAPVWLYHRIIFWLSLRVPDQYLRRFVPSHYVSIGCFQGRKMLGFAFLYIKGIKAHVGIAVTEEFRRRGVASKLMKELFQLASSRNVKELHLSVNKDNFAAISLYKKLGFVTKNETRNSLIMKRLILLGAVYERNS